MNWLAIPNSTDIIRTLSFERWLRSWVCMCLIVPCWSSQLICPPSTGLRAKRSNFQQIMPCASPRCIRLSISLKIGRPGILAVRFSTNSSAISKPSCFAKARSSTSWPSMDKTCLSSTSVDLRAYRKYSTKRYTLYAKR